VGKISCRLQNVKKGLSSGTAFFNAVGGTAKGITRLTFLSKPAILKKSKIYYSTEKFSPGFPDS